MERTLKIHPIADMFPMLNPDELLDLAESIKAEGQHTDIVLDADGTILDGRNRLAACQIAGIEPRFTTYTGSNPATLILSSNVRRRHISKGQQAMTTVIACSLSGHSLQGLAKLHGLSRSRLSAANVVLKHDPDLAEQVRNGTLSLDTAHNTVSQSKARAAALQKQHDRLRAHAPDLAERITEGHITLEDAAAILDKRLETQRVRQYVITARLADGDTTPPLAELVERGDITWPEAHQRAAEFSVQRRDTIHRSRQALLLVAENWTAVQDLAARPDTPYARDVLNGLAPEARSLAQTLITQA
ncbi:ParB/RepB/Spo0J family partition protein [Streptomyces sp. NPDC087218]|uniref:ParB/RepB/Spo0J family partition protein n=1 Tax=Streptomyces sp. NPDC087218 TaxID=3365769 RepID=UPI00382A50A2